VKERPEVTVVIPALNEATTVGEVIRGCLPHADQILVVDGFSKDGTAEVAEKCGARVLQELPHGKGAAMRGAIPFISGEITVFIDADGSHDPADIPRLIAPIVAGEADHVGGSRLLGGSGELHGGFDEFFRLAGSSFITACINKRCGVRISDSQNGFRAIRTEVLRNLGLEETITTIEQEMIIKTLRQGYRLTEVPTFEHPRKGGETKMSRKKVWFRYGVSLVKYLFF